mmetsp:Transcript_11791/g.20074  ORF Transcript_11791/g.20074 Transcript_11791/m.20074 type:complete len:87 (+) Transcript_11791:219-479(+)|eukprot:CAMPEP_0184338006 /NCGR_PEP_ID=MMETSP1089-20130417/6518_1 /TAXON_ID=38269 ORGANISM="Gloeochaete wittrockiana, Strain SAG46.84" /NCGR_SAMPLE_ID=MMETSP1089 /ASSEMBLY_ACC=CAM_ASM_000445 /LENGTH=86 /DNA_ID=CAMNT_0026664221 /DNA_START=188 /DNA_END=448 /DNA_ORIENTATION=-
MDCPLCKHPYNTPKLLPDCGHTLCLNCLRDLEKDRCPFCHTKFSAKKSTFPTDFTLKALISDDFLDGFLAYRCQTTFQQKIGSGNA